MNEKSNFQPLLFTVLLIVAGTLSPSNGLDDRINKTPLELISILIGFLLFGTFGFLVLNFKSINVLKKKFINKP